jgi:hypothetical protein
MATALTKDQAIALASRSHARDLKLRHHKRAIEMGLVRKACLSLGAAGLGALKKHGAPNDIKGFPWKLGLFTIASAGEVMTEGMLQTALGAIADTTLVVYTHDAVATGSLVAGEGGEL